MVKTGKRESLSRRDVELLIRWLMRDEGVVVSDGSVSLWLSLSDIDCFIGSHDLYGGCCTRQRRSGADKQVIRILEDGQAVGDHPITEVERGIVSVKNALRKVELQIESVEQQIERYVSRLIELCANEAD